MTGESCSTAVARQVFLVGVATVFSWAFLSIYIQLPGLYGANGIIPIQPRMAVEDDTSTWEDHFKKMPNLLWLHVPLGLHMDVMMDLVMLVGVFVATFAAVFHTWRNAFSFSVLWVCYYSIYSVGDTFLHFQWDILLLEVGFLAVLVAPLFPRRNQLNLSGACSFFMVEWLLFRLMFLSGIVKLTSECPTWWGLTAMDWHYESQCIPQPLAWYAHMLPHWFQALSVVGVLVIEIVFPFGFFLPFRSIRRVCAWSQVILMGFILVTGNYNFFNILTSLLAVSVLNDEDIQWLVPSWFFNYHCVAMKGEKGEEGEKSETGEKEKTKEEMRNTGKKTCNSSKSSHIETAMDFLALLAFLVFIVWILVEYFAMHVDVDKWTVETNITFSQKEYETFVTYSISASIALGVIVFIFYTLKTITVAAINKQVTIANLVSTVLHLGIIALLFSASCETMRWNDHNTTLQTLPHWDKIMNLEQQIRPYSISNTYGLFRRMTGVGGRPEVIIEGSYDKLSWQEYNFKYKPGNVSASPSINVPHQPRLDWQMWFAALGSIERNMWLQHLAIRLLEGSEDVLALLSPSQPYGFTTTPPKFIRIQRYTYHFTSKETSEKGDDEGAEFGLWWWRKQSGGGLYLIEIDLVNFADPISSVRRAVMGGKETSTPINTSKCNEGVLCSTIVSIRSMAKSVVNDMTFFVAITIGQIATGWMFAF
eukprot:m.116780 g.116780  ORF g.116780 m.116780 type:complete len:705 (-) comp9310_c0_seq1:147-2261(-)